MTTRQNRWVPVAPPLSVSGSKAPVPGCAAPMLRLASLSSLRHVCSMRLSLPVSAILGLTLSGSAWADDALPKRAPNEVFEAEPTLMLNDLPGSAPDSPEPLANEVDEANEANVRRTEAALERAQRRAVAGERLFKSGILAKVEAEKRTLQVVRLRSELENARARAAAEVLARVKEKFAAKEAAEAEVAAAEVMAVAASNKAVHATEELRRAELEAAELNLSRHRKLLAAGVGRKALVKRAEEQLEALKNRPAK